MATGTVKWFNPTKGYGFIERTDEAGGKDVFCHARAVREAGLRFLNEGDEIEFDLSPDDGKGPSAINLKKIS